MDAENRNPLFLLRLLISPLWKDWPMDMTCASLPPQAMINQPPSQTQDYPFSISGPCPHCQNRSVFVSVTKPYSEPLVTQANQICGYNSWAVLQCQGCKKFILGGVSRDPSGKACTYLGHFPLGKPDDEVASEIPPNIAADFKEALRCRWVDAYNATVEMCRRAVQSSCNDLGASGKSLFEQIDDLAAKAVITKPLKEMAHRVRLGGNLGAHPTETKITDVDADAVISFTKHYFEHVYVMPAALQKVSFTKEPTTQ